MDELKSFLEALEARGAEFWFEGSQLRFRAPQGTLSADARGKLARHRDTVLALLRERADARVTQEPMSYGQRSLWLVHQENPASAAYNVAFVVEVRSAMVEPVLREALQMLLDRHPALRTTYAMADGRPVQRIHGRAPAALEMFSRPGLDDESLRALIASLYRRPFDLQQGPVMRTTLVSRGEQDHVLMICAHHIAVDGWSLLVLLDELRQILAGLTEGKAPALPRPELTCVDHSRWQAQWLTSPQGEAMERYWLEQLKAPRAQVEFPTDRTRPARKSVRGATIEFTIDSSLTAGLNRLARAEGATLYALMLAAFKVLLFRCTGTEDVIVGTPLLGRSNERFERTVGHFVNPVPLRSTVQPQTGFRELLQQVRETLHQAIAAEAYPLALMVERLQPERDPSRSPLFETMFVLQRFSRFGELGALLHAGADDPLVDFGGLQVRPYPLLQQEGQFDLGLGLVEQGDHLSGVFKYGPDLFDASTIERLIGLYVELLRAVVADPSRAVGRLPLLTAAQRAVLVGGDAPAMPVSGGQVLHHRFERQVAMRPGATALRVDGRSLSYDELNLRANRVAHRLRRLGAGPGSLVGLCLERGADLLAGLLGILKAGAAYLPIDPSYPTDRVAFMLGDAKAGILLTQQVRPANLPAFEGVELCVDAPDLSAEASTNPDAPVGPDDLIYAIYTSGSTGRPKGTLLTHRAVDRLLDATQAWYGFDHTDRWTLFHSVAFDFSVWEIWGALAYGGCLVVVPYMDSRTPSAFVRLVQDEKVTVLNQTPSAFRQFIQASEGVSGAAGSLRHVIFGGEALELQSLRPWFERHGDQQPRLVNMYGITETCVHVTYRPVTLADLDAGRRSLIGVPIPDLRVHVLDAEMEPCPIGVAGEMYVGGPGLALGYLNRPELTAERFVPDPFRPGERLYRSGDLARRLPDGDLEFIGRKDHQVKIRGFRIELGEIESTLSALPLVKQAAVIVRSDARAGEQLTAYVVGDGLTAADLRGALRASLPEFMVPASFVFLDALPLTGNSKVDVRALPAPGAQKSEGSGTAPRTPQEARLLALWRDVLSQPLMGIHDNFFDNGGHSLLAVELLDRVETLTGVRIGFADVFLSPTVAAMTELLNVEDVPVAPGADPVPELLERLESLGVQLVAAGDKLRVQAPKGALDDELKAQIALHKPRLLQVLTDVAAAVSEDPARASGGWHPLSHMQQRLWFLKQLDPGNVAYNIPCSIRFQGDVDEVLMDRCLVRLMQRHESLRTGFIHVDGDPRCVVAQEPVLPLERVDLQHLPEAERDAEMQRHLQAFTGQPFDISRAPLFRALHVRLSPGEWVLCLVFDHMVCDGLSIGLLLGELRALYTELKGGAPASLAPLPVQYLELMERQRQGFERGALARHLDFWRTQLAGLPPVLQLPTDRPRPPVQTYRGGRRTRMLARDLSTRLRGLGRQTGATPFMLLLSAFQILLHRYAGVDDVAVGTAVSNRTQREAAGVVGFFANNVVLRSDLSGQPTVLDFIARVRETCLASMAHQEMPFDALVDALVTRREADHSPLFQVLFVLQNWVTPRMPLPGGTGELMVVDGTTARYDLSVDVFAADDAMAVYFEYNTDLFDAATIDRMIDHYQNLLDDMLAHPQARIDDLVMLGEGERRVLLDQWNQTAAPYPREQTVHGLFEAQVARTPRATALRFEEQALSYGQLNERANRVAHQLRALGAGAGSLVGVWLERGVDMVVAVLGVLKAGAAYVPLDPAFPQDRLDYMMEDAGLRIVLTQASLAGGLPAGVTGLRLDADAAALAAQPADNPAPLAAATDLAYVIYTSGSTGRPKGVMLEHRSVVNFLLSMQRQPGIAAGDRFVAVTTLSFDIAGLEIHGPLTVGGTVVLASRTTALDGQRLAELLDQAQAHLLQATPATWRLLLDSGWRGRPGLKMLCGGEGLPRELAGQLLATGGELWNMYGPTETTIWSTVWRVTDTERAISIGRPIANTQVYVLEPSGLPAPVGVAGELCIGGDGLARGYRHREDLTAEKFVTLDLPGLGPQRVYRTGDMVRFLADGRLEFVGRRDHQVKVRGFRIELGEIETVLARHEGLKACVVHVREDTPGDQRLVAYVVPQPGVVPEAEAMRATLRTSLPEYMVPNQFVVLDAFPLTPNGKVDRKALPAPAAAEPGPSDEAMEALMNPVQRQVAALWRSVLGTDRVGLHANFFDIGGHSLLLVRLQAAIQREFGQAVPLVELFQRTTVAAQAERLAAPVADSGALERARARAARQIQTQG